MVSVKQWNHVAGVHEGRGWGKRQTKLKGSASLPICFFGLYAVTSLAFPCLFGLMSLMRYTSLRIFWSCKSDNHPYPKLNCRNICLMSGWMLFLSMT